MKKRKLLFGSLAIAALATLAACGGGDNPTTTTPAPTTTTTVAPTTTPTPTTTPAPTTTPNPTTTPTTPTTPQVQTYTVTIQVSHGKAEDAFDGTAVSSISEIPAGTPISYDQETKIIKIGDPTQATSEAIALTADSGYLITGVKLSDGKDLPAKVEGNLTIVVQVEQEAAQTVTVTLKGIDPYDATKEATEEVTLDQTDANTGEKFGMLQYADPTNEYKEFVGWYLDADCTQEADATGITAAVTLYAKWKAVYETVTTGIGITGGYSWQKVYEAAGGTGTLSANYTFPQTFTIGNVSFVISSPKAYLEAAGDINTQGSCTIEIVLTGEGTNNAISSTGAKWGSGTNGRIILNKVVDGEVTEVAHTDSLAQNQTVDLKWEGLEAGTYRIVTEKSARIYNLTITEKKEKAPISGIELVSAGETDYLVGLHTAYSTAGLSVNTVRANGAKEAVDLAQLTIDSTAVDFTQAGEYEVTITYGNYEPVTHKVTVYAVDELEVQDYILNSSRVTQPLQTVYLQGQGNATAKNLAVKAVGKLTTETGEKACAFVLPATAYQVTAPSLAEAGLKNFEISFGGKTATYEVLVTTKLIVGDNSQGVSILVDKDAESFVTHDDTSTVKTINQAMQLLELSELAAELPKRILVNPGTYNEKVEVKLPNVAFYNKGTISLINNVTPRSEILTEENQVVIVYDALAGYLDAEGHAHSTDGSATFSVRSTATGFMAAGVTFKNYYNTHELYTESRSLVKDTQAVALLVEADEAMFGYCNISSYHDTLYAREGRQLYYDCYIEGRTDYIFGDRTVSALFEKCVIHTLGANLDKNGGYVACNKGSNSEYGYIFDNCVFEADAINAEAGTGVADATVSLGRTWDEKMRLYIVNSTISSAYAKADFGATTEGGKNTRYTEMNKGKSPSKALIKEYNNTGDGALAAQEAAEYTSVEVLSTFDVNAAIVKLFSSNANVTYPITWLNATRMAVPTTAATVNLISANANTRFTSIVGGTMSQAYAKEAFAPVLTDGQTIVGFYSDEALTTAYDFTTPFTETTNIYVKVDSSKTVTAALYKVDDLETGEITSEVKWGGADSIVTLVGSSSKKLTVDAAEHKYTLNGQEVTSAKRLKTGGATDSTGRYIKIDLSEFSGKAKLEIFVMTGSNSTARTGQVRIDSVSGTSVLALNCPTREGSDPVPNQSVEVECGHVYYITADAAINFYAIAISPVAGESGQQGGQQETLNEKFDAKALTAAADKEAITQNELGEFFTLVGTGEKRLTSGAVSSVEFKDGGLTFTVTGNVTVTAKVASTGSANTSLVALYQGETAVAATSVARESGDVIGVTGNVYDVYSSGKTTTLVWTLTAGTYTLKGVTGTSTGGTYGGTAVTSSEVGRAARFLEVTVVSA